MDSKLLLLFALIPVLASAAFDHDYTDSHGKKETYGKKNDCPHGFRTLKGQKNCYRFSSDRTTWELARLKCHEMGGFLAIIEDQYESDAITEYLNRTLPRKVQRGDHDFWIGLQDRANEGYFNWDTQPLKFVLTPTDRDVRFHNFQDDEPNSTGPGNVGPIDADCVRISNVDRQSPDLWKWGDFNCDILFFYLCEAKPRNPFRCNTH